MPSSPNIERVWAGHPPVKEVLGAIDHDSEAQRHGIKRILLRQWPADPSSDYQAVYGKLLQRPPTRLRDATLDLIERMRLQAVLDLMDDPLLRTFRNFHTEHKPQSALLAEPNEERDPWLAEEQSELRNLAVEYGGREDEIDTALAAAQTAFDDGDYDKGAGILAGLADFAPELLLHVNTLNIAGKGAMDCGRYASALGIAEYGLKILQGHHICLIIAMEAAFRLHLWLKTLNYAMAATERERNNTSCHHGAVAAVNLQKWDDAYRFLKKGIESRNRIRFLQKYYKLAAAMLLRNDFSAEHLELLFQGRKHDIMQVAGEMEKHIHSAGDGLAPSMWIARLRTLKQLL